MQGKYDYTVIVDENDIGTTKRKRKKKLGKVSTIAVAIVEKAVAEERALHVKIMNQSK